MTPVVLIVGGGAVTKPGRLAAVRALGHDIVLVKSTGSRPSPEEHAHAKHFLTLDLLGPDFVSEVVAYCLAHDLEPIAVATFSEFTVPGAALLAEYLGLRGPSVRAAAVCRNKFLTRVACRDLPGTPTFALVRSSNDVRTFVAQAGGRVVVKPLNTAGAFGVAVVSSQDDIDSAWDELVSSADPILDAMLGAEQIRTAFLAEEYIDGFEISVESLTVDGRTTTLAIHDKVVPVEPPEFLEQYFVTPSPRIDAALARTIAQRTRNVLEAVGFRSGVTHVEFRVSGGEPWLVEINPRPGGLLVVDSVEQSTGIDLVSASVAMLVDGQLPTPTANGPVVARSVFPVRGTIEGIRGVEELQEHPLVAWVETHCAVGDVVQFPGLAGGVNFLLRGRDEDDADALIALSDELAAGVRFDYAGGTP